MTRNTCNNISKNLSESTSFSLKLETLLSLSQSQHHRVLQTILLTSTFRKISQFYIWGFQQNWLISKKFPFLGVLNDKNISWCGLPLKQFPTYKERIIFFFWRWHNKVFSMMGICISDSITMHDFQIIVKTFIIILNLQTTAIVGLTEWLDGPLRKVFLFLQMTIISHSLRSICGRMWP